MAQPDACPACGTPAEPGQEYCLHCGARIVPARRLSGFGHAWERRIGRYPGRLGLRRRCSSCSSPPARRPPGSSPAATPRRRADARTIVATSPVVTAPPRLRPRPSRRPRRARRAEAHAEAAARAEGGARAWRLADQNGYTVVIASIPARGNGLAEATAKAKEARTRGPPGRRRPRLRQVREPPPRLLRRLRGRLRLARGGADAPHGRRRPSTRTPTPARSPADEHEPFRETGNSGRDFVTRARKE